MDLKDNMNTDHSVNPKSERQENVTTESETHNENIKSVDESEKKVSAEINLLEVVDDAVRGTNIREDLYSSKDNSAQGVNDVVDGINVRTDLSSSKNNSSHDINDVVDDINARADAFSSNKNNDNCNNSANELNSLNFSNINSTEKSPQNVLTSEGVNNMENENESKPIETEKKNENVSLNEINNMENASLNVTSKVVPSEKTNNTYVRNGSLFIEVKGLLEVINAEDFAKNVNMNNAYEGEKRENSLISKRSLSIPNKIAPKIVPNTASPKVDPSKVAPKVVPSKVVPKVLPNKVAPKVVPSKVVPKVLPNKVAPKVVPSKVVPKVLPNKVAPKVLPNKVAPKVLPNKVLPKVVPKVVPKVTPKVVPKETNEQSNENDESIQKSSGLSKSSSMQKGTSLLMKAPIKVPNVLNKTMLNKSEITGKTVDPTKGKGIFRSIPKEVSTPVEPTIKTKEMVKMNFVPSKEMNNEEKAKMLLLKAEKSSFKFSPKIIPLLIKEKSVKHKAPPKGNIKHTLHYLKKAAEIKSKEDELAKPKRDSVSGISDIKKSSLINHKSLEKSKNIQKITPLKIEPPKKAKGILDLKKNFIKKPIPKLVSELKPKEKEKKKKILKSVQDKKEELPKPTAENDDSTKLTYNVEVDKLKSEKGEEVDKEKEKKNIVEKNEEPQGDKEEFVGDDNGHVTEREKSIDEKNEPEDEKHEKKLYDLTENETEKEDEKMCEEQVEREKVKKVNDDSDDENVNFVPEKGKEEKTEGQGRSLHPENEAKEEETVGDIEILEAEVEKLWDNEKTIETEKEVEEMEEMEDRKDKKEQKGGKKWETKEEQMEDDKKKEPGVKKESSENIKELKKSKTEIKKGLDQKLNKKVPKKGDNVLSKDETSSSLVTIKQNTKPLMNAKQSIKTALTLKQSIKTALTLKQSIKTALTLKQSIKAPLNLKQSVKSPLNIKQIVKAEAPLKHKATMKGNATFLKLKTNVNGSLKEKNNLKSEKNNDLEKSSINKNVPQRKSTLFMKKVNGLKKTSLSKNSVKDIDVEKKKVGKKINGSGSDKNVKKYLPDDIYHKNNSKKISSASFKNAASVLRKKTLGKSKSENMNEIMLNKSKTTLSSKSENIFTTSEQDKIIKKKELKEGTHFNKKTLHSKISKLSGKSNTSAFSKFSFLNDSDNQNKIASLEKNETASKGFHEMDKINGSLKKSKSLKKQKSKGDKKTNMSDDITNGEEKLMKKITKLTSSKKIKNIASQIKMDKKTKKTKLGTVQKGESANVIKHKDKKGLKKLKAANGSGNGSGSSNDSNNGSGNCNSTAGDGVNDFFGNELRKMKSLKDKWKNNYITPRIGMDKSNSINEKLQLSNSDSSNRVTPHSMTPRSITPPSVTASVSSKKLKKKKKKISSSLNVDDTLKKKVINVNARKNSPNEKGNMQQTERKSENRLDHPLIPVLRKENVHLSNEERRYQSVGNIGFLNLRESASFNFNKIKSTNPLRKLSFQVRLESPNELTTNGEPNLNVNNLYSKNPLTRKPSEIGQNSNWMFPKCCFANKKDSVYERKEPVVQNFSSLFNVNNKYIPFNTNPEMIRTSSNTVRLSNMYNSNLFADRMMNRSQPRGHPERQMTGQLGRQVTGHIDRQMTGQIGRQITGQIGRQMTGQIGKQMTGKLSDFLDNKMNSSLYANKSFSNNDSLRLKRRPSCIATTNYCSCI
ncbi:conserved Plasmodium protein, unknown function [Plasmodium ovale wallikeri]|uniref:Uncharacterized protein n=1 Tax=Plasmodium ovale wallikeri TaxID=864142 RepID=A0A1A8ZCJ7_PLAOA|nr:conserved Plasmodium protein, unknown function [Plasmodium ovale wallikeri]